jgi:hypothetical protein
LPYHRFKIAQVVTSLAPDMPPGPFVIVRLVPLIGNEPGYRVMSTIDGHLRAMPESQIKLPPKSRSQPPTVHLLLSMPATDNKKQANHRSF